VVLDLLHANDIDGHYPPSWYRDSASLLPEFETLDVDQNCDVCIIGAGFTGLSTALHLANTGYNVVLLDAHRVGWGASGRNGGQLGTGQRVDQMSLEQQLGLNAAQQLWEVSQSAKACVHELIATHAIDCGYRPGIVYADHKPGYVSHTRQLVELLNNRYDYSALEFLEQDRINEVIGTSVYYGGCIDRGAGHLHPLKLALGLAAAAQQAGVRIYENSKIVSTGDFSQTLQPQTATTARATVRCDKLVFACNGYLGSLAPEISQRVMPINNYIIATETLADAIAETILRGDVAASDSRFVVNYFRMSDDRRLLFGGRESYGYRFPSDIANFVRKAMLKIYPQLQNTAVEYGWGGTLAISRSRLPYVAQISPNVLTASGYSGHGIAMATYCGKLIAQTIEGQSRGFDAMAAIKSRRFPGGRLLREPLLVLAMLWYSLRDRL